jgi:hypothetical protein
VPTFQDLWEHLTGLHMFDRRRDEPMGDLSEHFSKWEFRDHRTGGLIGPDPNLLTVLERMRHATGDRPLHIVSGYRSPKTNHDVGGARNSQHLYGRAADVEPGRFTVEQALDCGAIGVGYSSAGWVVHVDVRPGAPVTFRDGP